MHSCPAKTEIQSHFLAKPLGIWKFYLISFWSRLIWAQLLSKRFFSILNRNNFKIFCPGGPRLAAPFRLGLLRRQIKTKLTFPPSPIYQLGLVARGSGRKHTHNKQKLIVLLSWRSKQCFKRQSKFKFYLSSWYLNAKKSFRFFINVWIINRMDCIRSLKNVRIRGFLNSLWHLLERRRGHQGQ